MPGLPQQTWTDEQVFKIYPGVSSEFVCKYTEDTKSCDVVIRITGDVKPAIFDEVKRAVAHAAEIGASVKWFELVNSNGGNVDAAMAIGRLLRKMEVPIYLGSSGTCASSCIFVLIGAVHRDIDGKVGIHRPYFETPTQALSREAVKSAYERTVQRLREYLREMGVSERLADSMMAIPPEQMRYLSKTDLESYGVSEFDPTWKETIDVREAQKYGLTRREYTRRRMHAQKSCSDFACYNRVMKHGQ